MWGSSACSEPFAQAMLEAGGLVVTVDEAKGLEFDRTAVLKPYTSWRIRWRGAVASCGRKPFRGCMLR
ncbi:MAG: hypothetical protein ACUVSV_09915 [Armatimonadota bacterium]